MTDKIIIITGPSGSGKSTLVDKFIQKNPKFKRIITYTTREKRGGEIDGMDYNFISEDEFRQKIQEGFFFEWSEVYGKLYGTANVSFDANYNKYGKIIISNPRGAFKLSAKLERDSYITIFIDAAYPEIIKKRLEGRNQQSKDDINNRLSELETDYEKVHNFDYKIVNDDLQNALEELEDIVKSNFPNSVEYPICVNFFGGPGVGKSTNASKLYSELKTELVSCELVTEFAKDLTWQKNYKSLNNQFYVSAVQHHKMFQLVGNVDVIITDCPLLTGLLYCPQDIYPFLQPLLFHEYNNFNNINIYLKRNVPFSEKGRNQTLEEAVELDKKLTSMLNRLGIEYIEHNYPMIDNVGEIKNLVIKMLEKEQNEE